MEKVHNKKRNKNNLNMQKPKIWEYIIETCKKTENIEN